MEKKPKNNKLFQYEEEEKVPKSKIQVNTNFPNTLPNNPLGNLAKACLTEGINDLIITIR
jgi:hypothetical protein